MILKISLENIIINKFKIITKLIIFLIFMDFLNSVVL